MRKNLSLVFGPGLLLLEHRGADAVDRIPDVPLNRRLVDVVFHRRGDMSFCHQIAACLPDCFLPDFCLHLLIELEEWSDVSLALGRYRGNAPEPLGNGCGIRELTTAAVAQAESSLAILLKTVVGFPKEAVIADR